MDLRNPSRLAAAWRCWLAASPALMFCISGGGGGGGGAGGSGGGVKAGMAGAGGGVEPPPPKWQRDVRSMGERV
jgi:hypothetical protein